jgi:hypothetical protein
MKVRSVGCKGFCKCPSFGLKQMLGLFEKSICCRVVKENRTLLYGVCFLATLFVSETVRPLYV